MKPYIAILLMAAACPLRAEGYGEPAAPAALSEEYLQELDKELELTEKQKKKVRSVAEEARPRLKEQWERARKLREQAREAEERLRELERDANERIRETLDHRQRDRFDQMRLRRRPGSRRRWRGGPMDKEDLPPAMRKRLERPEHWSPPEMWEEPGGEERGLPPEIQEYIERRRKEGARPDLPPPDQWHDGR